MVVVPVTMEMRDDNGNAAQLTGGWCANTLGSSDVAIEVPALMGVAPQCWSGHLVRRRRSGNHLCDNRLMNAPLPLLSSGVGHLTYSDYLQNGFKGNIRIGSGFFYIPRRSSTGVSIVRLVLYYSPAPTVNGHVSTAWMPLLCQAT